MKETKRFNVFLVIMALLFGAFYYYFEVIPAKKGADNAVGEFILNFKPEDVIEIYIAGKKGEYIFQRDKNNKEKWFIKNPLFCNADGGSVENMLKTISSLKIEELVTEKILDLSPFGLNKPYVFKLRLNNKNEFTLLIGGINPGGSFAYIQRGADSPVYLAPKEIINFFEKDVVMWRDKNLWDKDLADNLIKFEYNLSGKKITFSKTDEKKWKILEKKNSPPDEEKIEILIDKWRKPLITNFEKVNGEKMLRERGLLKPQKILKLYLKDEKSPLILYIGEKKDKQYFYATKDQKEILYLSNYLLENLDVNTDIYLKK